MSYSNINHAVLIGRLTRDPELRELPSGNAVCNLRIACNSVRRDAEGEYRERPNYFDVAAFSGLAETIARYMRRGSLVAVAGRLEWQEWETPEHGRRQSVRVVAEAVQFLERAGTRGERELGDDPGPDGAGSADGAASGAEDEGEGELVGAGAGAEVDLVF